MSRQEQQERAERYMWEPKDLQLKSNPSETWPVDNDELEYGSKELRESRSAYLKRANDSHRDELQALARGFFEKGYPTSKKELDSRLAGLASDFGDLIHKQIKAGYEMGAAHVAKGKELSYKRSSRDTRKALNRIEQRSNKYFSQYMDDLRSGVAATTQNDFNSLMGRFVNRLGMYSSGQWQSVWQGFGDALGDESPVTRVLDDNAQHCDTCPDKAKTYDNFTAMVDEAGVPGDGSDTCGGNCRCTLEEG